jgi:hypothetical protein
MGSELEFVTPTYRVKLTASGLEADRSTWILKIFCRNANRSESNGNLLNICLENHKQPTKVGVDCEVLLRTCNLTNSKRSFTGKAYQFVLKTIFLQLTVQFGEMVIFPLIK